MKRLFDILFSSLGLFLLLPLFFFVAILIKINSKGPIFFKHERIGKDFVPFNIIKFRTMTSNNQDKGLNITVSGDRRITTVGRYLRKYKIDELAQLINVLKGDMSFVGPRPEVIEYVRIYQSEYSKLLTVKPGITDPASIEFKDEELILARSDNAEDEYINRILPEKISLSNEYLNNRDLLSDIKIIFKTIFLKIR